MYFDDKDYEQKVKFQKILWSMGHWARIEIPIVIYEDNSKSQRIKKHDLTDIDVYGEIIQSDFSFIKSIGDCKSGKNVKIFERLFWLKGVKEYLNVEQAYLIKRTITPKAKLFMPKANIKGIDDKALLQMEKIYHTNSLKLFSDDYYREKSIIINQLTKEYKKIFDYMNTRYWFTDLDISMRVLMTMLKKNDFYKQFKKDNKVHRFLLMEICIMLSRTLFDCCKYIMFRDITDVEQGVLEYIHGGINGYNNKMQMIREISTPINEIFGSKEIINKIMIKPDYFDEMLKLIVILIGEASNAADITRYMEVMQHEIILGDKFDYSKIIGLSYSSVGHKLSKDIISFYLKINKINIHFFEDVFTK